jgi:threonylcarbamoyladenosine tRNA methylthiotransferase MtaB
VRYAVVTFGCRVNQADSMDWEQQLRARGASPAPLDCADVVVVNTCSVTAAADQGARQTIRRIARANARARIIVTGCYASRRPDEVEGLPGVAGVVTNDDKPRLIWALRDLGACGDSPMADVSTAERYGSGDAGCGAHLEPGAMGRTAFLLRVQTGCAEPCTYCIIPATRGAPRSVPLDEVRRRSARAVEAGFKELVLTGVHLGSYGRDLAPRRSLIDLLRTLARDMPPDRLIRISSLEPMDCEPALVDLVAGHGAFAPHFHLPLQHASDRVLACMRRPYTLGQYAALVERIRAAIPGAALGADVIVGFPGEDDDDFQSLERYLSASPLTHLHVFPYSDRPGTEASAMRGKVPGGLIRARAMCVRTIGDRLTADFRRSQIGTVHRALTIEDGRRVMTPNYIRATIPSGRRRNEWVRVRITEGDAAELVP